MASCSPCPPAAQLSSRHLRWRAAVLLLGLGLVFTACGGSSSPTSPTPSTSNYTESAFRHAADITAAAQVEIGRTLRPGLFERDVKGIIDGVFRRDGGMPPAFPHIVAGGPNALELHYEGDSRQLMAGDLLVVDIGATSNGHCSDLTRTYAVSGQMTPRQRELYDLVLGALQSISNSMKVGVDSLQSADAWVRSHFRSSPLRAIDASGVETTLDRFFIHSLGHYVGRQIHGEDTGWSSRSPIEVGQVLTIEPGLYIPSEGIGIRIEDTFLVTPTGLQCLTCAAPK